MKRTPYKQTALLTFGLLALLVNCCLGALVSPPHQSARVKALITAIERGDLATLKRLIQSPVRVDSRLLPYDPHTILLPPGALVDVKPSDNPTLLMCAAYYGQSRMVQWLLDQGAPVNVRGIYLIEASEGVDASTIQQANVTPLHLAALQGHVRVMQLLLDHHADINAQDEQGWTPLRWSVEDNRLAATRLLLKRGAKVNVQAKDGSTALMDAARQGRLGQVELLIRAKANVNLKDKKGNTALRLAAQSGEAQTYYRLRQAGAVGQEPLRHSTGILP